MLRHLVIGFALAALALPSMAMTEGYAEHDGEVRTLLESVSWDAPTVIEVILGDHSYSPSDLTLPLGKPVILRLRNQGGVSHDMVGGSVFQAVLVKHVTTASGRVVAPYIQSVFVRSRFSTDIWLLPIKAGTYTFYCSIEGHREDGMEGRITIR